MKITITMENKDGEVIAKKEALSFESAEEALGKLERIYKSHLA